jgi:hypothetical protein
MLLNRRRERKKSAIQYNLQFTLRLVIHNKHYRTDGAYLIRQLLHYYQTHMDNAQAEGSYAPHHAVVEALADGV